MVECVEAGGGRWNEYVLDEYESGDFGRVVPSAYEYEYEDDQYEDDQGVCEWGRGGGSFGWYEKYGWPDHRTTQVYGFDDGEAYRHVVSGTAAAAAAAAAAGWGFVFGADEAVYS